MYRRSLVVLFVCVLASSADAASWGVKSRLCPKLEARLAALEASSSVSPRRLARVRERWPETP